jgi:hypothetical protein
LSIPLLLEPINPSILYLYLHPSTHPSIHLSPSRTMYARVCVCVCTYVRTYDPPTHQ